MKATYAGILAVVCVLAMSPMVRADWDPTMPYKMHYPQLPDPNGWDVLVTAPKILADDFKCTQSGPITDVHFWGSWRDDIIGQLTSIHLSIHADDRTGAFSKPGNELWSWNTTDFGIVPVDPPSLQGWYDPNTQQWLPQNHRQYFQYNIQIPAALAFPQKEGTIYWLDIWTTVAPDPRNPPFGWKTSVSQHFEDDAVWADIPAGGTVPVWQELKYLTGGSMDLAFVITPEPATLCLLGLGAASLLARRRRK
jgi:hypothetical protein